MKGRCQIDRNNCIPFFGWELINCSDVLDTCIVDQDVATTRLFNQRAALGALGHIGLNVADRDARLFGHQCCQSMIICTVSKRIEDNVGPCSCHLPCNAKPDARIGACDNRCLTIECHVMFHHICLTQT